MTYESKQTFMLRKAQFLTLGSEGNFSSEALQAGPRDGINSGLPAAALLWMHRPPPRAPPGQHVQSASPRTLTGWGGERRSPRLPQSGETWEKCEGWRYCIPVRQLFLGSLSRLFTGVSSMRTGSAFVVCEVVWGCGTAWAVKNRFSTKIALHWI